MRLLVVWALTTALYETTGTMFEKWRVGANFTVLPVRLHS